MKQDQELFEALLSKLSCYQERVPVHRVQLPRLEEMERAAIALGQSLGGADGFKELRFDGRREKSRTVFRMQEGITVTLFPASGAMTVKRDWSPMSRPYAEHADRADLKLAEEQADRAVRSLELPPRLGSEAPRLGGEALRFERLWQLKAAAVTKEGKRTPVALTRVVGAFRRHLNGLAVLGRASIHVELAERGLVAAASVDWRPVQSERVDQARVLAPEEGAKRVLAELQSYWPGGRFTLEQYEPELFTLGYFSMPRRRPQTYLQPAFVAMFRPTGPVPSLGRVIVVPAGEAVYESMQRLVSVPPVEKVRPQGATKRC